mgnify:FL=1
MGLNRTSVGLKRRLGGLGEGGGGCLNRTSVGLKLTTELEEINNRVGLNRTSVGLKRIAHNKSSFPRSASIEPAWD